MQRNLPKTWNIMKFIEDTKTVYAVIRAIEIIGEATQKYTGGD